jgi:hypothetical protein
VSYDDWKLKTPPEYEEMEVEEDKRSYNREIPDYADVMTLADWEEAVERGSFIPDDGIGYWCKDGKESRDEVFETDAEDATHVAWYNK